MRKPPIPEDVEALGDFVWKTVGKIGVIVNDVGMTKPVTPRVKSAGRL